MREYPSQAFADDFIFLEAPRWHDDRLWLSDVFDHKVYKLDLQGHRSQVCEIPHRPSGLGFLPDGTLVVVSSKDRRLMTVRDGVASEYADLHAFAVGDLNDFAIDSDGRIYVGNFGYDYDAGEPKAATDIHCVERDRTIRIAASGVEFPNGSVFLNDEKTLVVAETWAGRLLAFEKGADGKLSGRRVFADLEGREPDGICVDAEDGVWVACFNTGEFLRVLDGGRITDRVRPSGCGISCALGGIDGTTLFCTAYTGTMKDLGERRRLSAVFTSKVDVPAKASLPA